MDVESLTAAAMRAQLGEDAKLGNCTRTWNLGFFFDGIHRNIEQDAPENRCRHDWAAGWLRTSTRPSGSRSPCSSAQHARPAWRRDRLRNP